jgi:AcrR family transcriptional regulator
LKEKEKKILDAALKLFAERGFHGTSTAEIAKTAGVATGTLFHYFNTKEELINRLYLHIKESMLNEVSGDYNDKKTLKENLRALWLKFAYFGLDEGDKFQFILTFHCSPYITSLTKEQIETQTESMLGVYIKGIEKREIKEIPFEMAMDYFWGNVVSIVNYFEKYPENLNEKNLDLAFELFWDGISQ